MKPTTSSAYYWGLGAPFTKTGTGHGDGADTLARQVRQQMLRVVRRRLSLLAVPARRLHRMLDDGESLVHRGFRVPPRYLRGLVGGEAFRSDDFYLQSAVVEATRLPA